MTRRRLTASVIIPTINRPADLARCLRSILAQQRRPEEVIVVDDGESDVEALAALFDGTEIGFRYIKKDIRGPCRSRNQGVRASSGDILVFLDDDTELDRRYIAAFVEAFEADPDGRLGGVSGNPTRYRHGVELASDHEVHWEERLKRVFLLSSGRSGRVLPSGYRTSMVHPVGNPPVDFLQGGNMALRRAVFVDFQFDESLDRLAGYAPGEDVMFSYPVGRRYELRAIEEARMKHFHSPGGRPDAFLMAKARFVHQYRFVHETMGGGGWQLACFAWATVGLFVIHGIGAVLFAATGRPVAPRLAAMRGTAAGILHTLTQPRPPRAESLGGLLAPMGD